MKNLEEVEYLEMKVDTRDNSLGNFGKCDVYADQIPFLGKHIENREV